jgi:hypothetical protein
MYKYPKKLLLSKAIFPQNMPRDTYTNMPRNTYENMPRNTYVNMPRNLYSDMPAASGHQTDDPNDLKKQAMHR